MDDDRLITILLNLPVLPEPLYPHNGIMVVYKFCITIVHIIIMYDVLTIMYDFALGDLR